MRKSVLQEDIPAARLSMRGSALIDLDTKDTKEKKDYMKIVGLEKATTALTEAADVGVFHEESVNLVERNTAEQFLRRLVDQWQRIYVNRQ